MEKIGASPTTQRNSQCRINFSLKVELEMILETIYNINNLVLAVTYEANIRARTKPEKKCINFNCMKTQLVSLDLFLMGQETLVL